MPADYRATAEPYQARVEQFIIDNPRCAVWAEPGLRKTGMTLAATRQLLAFREVQRVLVVAPLNALTLVWVAESRKWSLFNDLTMTVIRGAPSWRLSLTNRQTDIHLINYEGFEWLANMRANDWPYGAIVLDEADNLKNPESVRFKVMVKLLAFLDRKHAKGRGPFVRLTELTGTPSPQGLQDIWSQVYLLDQGAALGDNYGSFRMRWFESTGRYAVGLRDGAQEEIHDKVAHLAVSLSAADYLKLPDMIVNRVTVELSPKCMDEYKTLEREALLELARERDVLAVSDALEDGGSDRIGAFTAAAKMQKCQQYASGAVYLMNEDNTPSTEWREFHKAKVDALRDIISEAAGAPVLVVYWFKHDLERLRKAFPKAVLLTESDANANAWSRGEVQIGLIGAGKAVGLNLQDGGNILVWFSLVWSLRLFIQTNKRLHRSGQTKPVFVHLLLAQGTVDEDIPERLDGKATIQSLLMARLALLDQPLLASAG